MVHNLAQPGQVIRVIELLVLVLWPLSIYAFVIILGSSVMMLDMMDLCQNQNHLSCFENSGYLLKTSGSCIKEVGCYFVCLLNLMTKL